MKRFDKPIEAYPYVCVRAWVSVCGWVGGVCAWVSILYIYICIYIFGMLDIRWSGRGLVFGRGNYFWGPAVCCRIYPCIGCFQTSGLVLGSRALEVLRFSVFRV